MALIYHWLGQLALLFFSDDRAIPSTSSHAWRGRTPATAH